MSESPEVLSFRVGELDRNMRELRGEFKEAIGQVGGGLTALQTQLASYQASTADRFVPRRDFDARQREIEDRFKELANQRDQNANRLPVWISAAFAGLSLIIGIIGWFRPPFH